MSNKKKPSINSLEWNDYVLGLLTDDEKIAGNPTTDGLRRIFEIALDCIVISADSNVVQSPDPSNEKRATVVHNISYILKNTESDDDAEKYRSVSGAADVYWGNCDKIYRNHPVAVAETRAEGRALRRGLRLRKVVAAEELATNVEDDVTGDNVGKITSNQISFIDVIAKRVNVNVLNLIESMSLPTNNIRDLTHDNAVSIIRELSKLQQSIDDIPDNIKHYQENWK
jgi:hypothetical protein